MVNILPGAPRQDPMERMLALFRVGMSVRAQKEQAEQNAAELKLRAQQLMQQAKAQKAEGERAALSALLRLHEQGSQNLTGGNLTLPDFQSEELSPLSGMVLQVLDAAKKAQDVKSIASSEAAGTQEGSKLPIPAETRSMLDVIQKTQGMEIPETAGGVTPTQLQTIGSLVGKLPERNVATQSVPEAGLVAGQAYDPTSSRASLSVWQEGQQNARTQQALGAKKPDPKEGDRIADAWAQGMSFPQTQEATNAALDSFERRGMQVPRRLSTPMQQDVIRAADTIQTLDDVKYLYEKVKSKVGPVGYRLSEFAQKVPGVMADPDFVAFNTMLRGMGNLEIKRITGAQMSEQEADRLLKGMATGTLKGPDFEAALNVMKRNAERNRDITLYGRARSMREGAGNAPQTPVKAEDPLGIR